MKLIVKILAVILPVLFFLCGALLSATYIRRNPQIIHDTVYICPELTEWEVMQLALIEEESNYDSLAVSRCNAIGPIQLTEIYVEEYNRLTGDSLPHNQAQCPQISLKIFDAINYTNYTKKDVKTAISNHNPNAGAWYLKRVLKAMDRIKTREYYRNLIVSKRNASFETSTNEN